MSDPFLPRGLAMDARFDEIVKQLRRIEQGAPPPPRQDLRPIQQPLKDVFGVDVELIGEIEYVYCESLVLCFSADGTPCAPTKVDPPQGRFVFAAYLRFSWLAPYAAIQWRLTSDGRHWRVLTPGELPPAIIKVSGRLEQIVAEQGSVVLTDSVLDRDVPDARSGLDDSQATVYQVLFSDLD
jgi:hypothetical protein